MDEPQGQAGGGVVGGGSQPLLDDGHPDSLLPASSGSSVSPLTQPRNQVPRSPAPSISQMQGLKDALEKAGASMTGVSQVQTPLPPQAATQPAQQMPQPQRQAPPPPPVRPLEPMQQVQAPSVGFPFSTKSDISAVPVQKPAAPPQPARQPVAQVQPMSRPAAPTPNLQQNNIRQAVQPAPSQQQRSEVVPARQLSQQATMPQSQQSQPMRSAPPPPPPPPPAPAPAKKPDFQIKPFANAPTLSNPPASAPQVQALARPGGASSLQPARPLVPSGTILDEKVRQYVDKRLEDEGFFGKNPGTTQAVWDAVRDRPAEEITSGPLPTEEQAWEKYLNFTLLARAYGMVREVSQKSGKQPQQGQTVLAYLTSQRDSL